MADITSLILDDHDKFGRHAAGGTGVVPWRSESARWCGRHRTYNPFSYQRGSVWTHDNAILATGFARYGHHHEAWQVGRALFDAAAR